MTEEGKGYILNGSGLKKNSLRSTEIPERNIRQCPLLAMEKRKKNTESCQ